MRMEWTEEYSVGVKEIDEQHKYFFRMLNDIFDIFYSPDRQPQQILNVFDQAFNYGKYHFATEEKYFNQFNYDGAEEHIIAHQKFAEKMQELHKQFENDKKDPTLELLDTLEDWLVNHINKMDKKYTKCFNDHGLY